MVTIDVILLKDFCHLQRTQRTNVQANSTISITSQFPCTLHFAHNSVNLLTLSTRQSHPQSEGWSSSRFLWRKCSLQSWKLEVKLEVFATLISQELSFLNSHFSNLENALADQNEKNEWVKTETLHEKVQQSSVIAELKYIFLEEVSPPPTTLRSHEVISNHTSSKYKASHRGRIETI